MAKYTQSISQLTRVHHIGIAVRDINKAIKNLETMGLLDFNRPKLPKWLEKLLFNGKTFDTEYTFFDKTYLHPSLQKVLDISPDFVDPSLAPADGMMYYNGKPFTAEYKIFKGKVGNRIIELFEPVKGATPWGDWMDKYGEGLHHIAFEVDNLDKEIAKLLEYGAKVIVSGRLQNGGGGDYLDFGNGIVIEVFKYYY